MLQVRFCAPSPNLSKLVRFYVQRKVQIGDRVVVHPVPARATPMIEFDFGDPVDVRYANQAVLLKAPKTVVVGLQTYRRVEMHLRGSLESFVIMFQPDGLHRLFSMTLNRSWEARLRSSGSGWVSAGRLASVCV